MKYLYPEPIFQEPIEAEFQVVRGAWTKRGRHAPLAGLALVAAAAVCACIVAGVCAGAALATALLAAGV